MDVQLARFTLPWRGRAASEASGVGWVSYPAHELTPPPLTSRYARCFADPPPPGEGEESSSLRWLLNHLGVKVGTSLSVKDKSVLGGFDDFASVDGSCRVYVSGNDCAHGPRRPAKAKAHPRL